MCVINSHVSLFTCFIKVQIFSIVLSEFSNFMSVVTAVALRS